MFIRASEGFDSIRHLCWGMVYFEVHHIITWLVVWNMNFIFHFIYGMSSFPLTNSYFSRWFFNHQPGTILLIRLNHWDTWTYQKLIWLKNWYKLILRANTPIRPHPFYAVHLGISNIRLYIQLGRSTRVFREYNFPTRVKLYCTFIEDLQ